MQRRKSLAIEIYVTWVAKAKALKTVEFDSIEIWSTVCSNLFDPLLTSAAPQDLV